MYERGYPKFVNDDGLPEIRIGVKEFECMGASPPHDHPHIYLDMGDEAEIRCPYCGTLFKHDTSLERLESVPEKAVYLADQSELT